MIHSTEGIGELNSKSGFMGRRKGEYVVSKNVAVRQSNWEAEDEGDSVVDMIWKLYKRCLRGMSVSGPARQWIPLLFGKLMHQPAWHGPKSERT